MRNCKLCQKKWKSEFPPSLRVGEQAKSETTLALCRSLITSH
jgi:hypothetical protein